MVSACCWQGGELSRNFLLRGYLWKTFSTSAVVEDTVRKQREENALWSYAGVFKALPFPRAPKVQKTQANRSCPLLRRLSVFWDTLNSHWYQNEQLRVSTVRTKFPWTSRWKKKTFRSRQCRNNEASLKLIIHLLAWASSLTTCWAADAFLAPKGKAKAVPSSYTKHALTVTLRRITPLRGLGCGFTTCGSPGSAAASAACSEQRALGLLVHWARNTLPDTEKALMFHHRSHAAVSVPMTLSSLGWHCRARRGLEEQWAMDVAW